MVGSNSSNSCKEDGWIVDRVGLLMVEVEVEVEVAIVVVLVVPTCINSLSFDPEGWGVVEILCQNLEECPDRSFHTKSWTGFPSCADDILVRDVKVNKTSEILMVKAYLVHLTGQHFVSTFEVGFLRLFVWYIFFVEGFLMHSLAKRVFLHILAIP